MANFQQNGDNQDSIKPLYPLEDIAAAFLGGSQARAIVAAAKEIGPKIIAPLTFMMHQLQQASEQSNQSQQSAGYANGGFVGDLIGAAKDAISPQFAAHQQWYENQLPELLDRQPGIPFDRSEGNVRDTTAEYAGAADWARKAPIPDYNRLINEALLYQRMNHGWSPNANSNFQQDKDGIAFGICNPTMSDATLLKNASSYAGLKR